jgi:hypothetical protein
MKNGFFVAINDDHETIPEERIKEGQGKYGRQDKKDVRSV